MTNPSQPHPQFHWLRELLVPVLMLIGIGAFIGDSLHLSVAAMLLPWVLIAVTVLSLLWALAATFLNGNRADAVAGEDEAPGPILNVKAWLLVAIPAVLMMLMEYLGAVVALVTMVFLAQLMFNAKTPVKSLLIAIAVTLPTCALFKFVLYARFPAGVLGLG